MFLFTFGHWIVSRVVFEKDPYLIDDSTFSPFSFEAKRIFSLLWIEQFPSSQENHECYASPPKLKNDDAKVKSYSFWQRIKREQSE